VRLHAIPFSTNVERVLLGLGHKGLDVELVMHDADDRSAIERLSGQPLVPVLEDGDLIVSDSTVILRHLERTHPDPPLLPAAAADRAEVDIFVDWFNRVWKRPPNLIADGQGTPELEAELRGSLDLFEALLDGRDHLFGAFGMADVIAFPFLKYGLIYDPDDDELFHRVLIDHLAVDGRPRTTAWICRVDERPRAG
jgi:glutathione S-transferase